MSALLGLAVYAVTIGGTYIYDDIPVVQLDKRLGDTSLWPLLWTRDYYYNVDDPSGPGSIDNLYRPLVSTTYALERFVHGDSPSWFHGVNVLLYGGCCALVALLGVRLGGNNLGWIAGLLFAAHPIHAEAVSMIVGRAELMALLGTLGALVLQLSGPPSLGRTLGILACTAFAILSKEQGMLVPFLLLAAEPARRMVVPPSSNPKVAREDALILIGLLSLSLGLYAIAREQWLALRFAWDRSLLDPAVQPMILSHGSDRTLMPFVLLGRYVHQLFWPAHLSFDYSGQTIGWRVSMADPHLYLGMLAAFAGVVGVSLAAVRRAWRAFFLLAAFALTYGVISNMVSLIGVNYGERLIFAPSAFFVLIISLPLAALSASWVRWAVAGLVVAGSIWTITYARRWNDRFAFYEWSLANEPRSMRLHQLVIDELIKRGEFDRAAEVATSARAIMPDYWDIYLESAMVAEKQRQFDQAEQFYAQAMKLRPSLASRALMEFRKRRAAESAPSTAPTTSPSR